MQRALAGHEIVGDIRGEGLMIGVELVADRASKRAFDPALKVGPRTMKAGMARGILCRALPHRDVLAFSPPLILTEAEADEIVAALAGAVGQIRDELFTSGDWRPA
jgi:L-2,4-diaminobutyrate transaminase